MKIHESRHDETKQTFNNARTPVAAIIMDLYGATFLKKSRRWCANEESEVMQRQRLKGDTGMSALCRGHDAVNHR